LVVLTSDHGVAPSPTVLEEQKLPGGRLKDKLADPVQKALEARFGPGKWVLDTTGASIYLNNQLIADHHLAPADVQKAAASALAALPQVARVYTREQLLNGLYPADRFDSRVVRSFNRNRWGDLEVILQPYWIRDSAAATHGAPYNYDTHIPLIFMGSGIRPGRYYRDAALNDLAPTVAALLDVEIPSGSSGRILDEILR
jgi:arylsulfatase A-like enzyme